MGENGRCLTFHYWRWQSPWNEVQNETVKKSTKNANILQKEKDQVKTNFKVIICCLSKKGGKDNSIYIFPCFIEQNIILYETIEYAMTAYAQSWQLKDKEQWNKKK